MSIMQKQKAAALGTNNAFISMARDFISKTKWARETGVTLSNRDPRAINKSRLFVGIPSFRESLECVKDCSPH